MIKFEQIDINLYKILSILIVIVSGLYNIGYWSTFDINILSYYDITEIITSFIFPFFLTVGALLIGLLFSDFFYLSLYKTLSYGGYESKKSKGFKYFSIIFYTSITAIMVLIIRYTGIEAWLICPLIGWASYSVFVVNFLIKQNIIAHEKFTIHIVQLSLLILALSYSVGKYNSLKIKNNNEFDYIFLENTGNSKCIHKYLGKAGNHYFFSPIDNASKTIIREDEFKILEIYHFDSYKFSSKIDSTINKMKNKK